MALLKPVSLQLELGPVLIGGHISSVLWGVTCVQTWIFVTRCRQDPSILKGLVGLVFILEALLTIILWMYSYEEAVIQGPSIDALFNSPWTLVGAFAVHEVTSALVQAFFAYRVRVVSRKLILSLLPWAVIFIRLSIAMVTVGMLAKEGIAVVMESQRYIIDITMGLVILVDGWNTGILCLYLSRAQRAGFTRTSDRISTIMTMIIETGIVMFVVALFTLVSWAASPVAGLWISGMFVYARLNSNALLVTLNARDWSVAPTMKENGCSVTGTVGVVRTYDVNADAVFLSTQTASSGSLKGLDIEALNKRDGPFSQC